MSNEAPKATEILHYTLARPGIPDKIATERFGMTVREAQAEGICIRCKRPKVFFEGTTDALQYVERQYYGRWALCLSCSHGFPDWLDLD